MAQAVRCVRRRGRIVFTEVYEAPVALDFGELLMKEASIIASHAFGHWGIAHEMELAVELMQQGVFRADRLVTQRFPLSGDTFKVQLIMATGS